MATALFSTPRFLLPQKKGVSGCIKSFKSSFLGQVIVHKGSVRRVGRSCRGGCIVVASVVGSRVKKRETVIPDPDYRIPVVLLGLSSGLAYTNNLLPAAPVGLLGLLLLFQTTRVRFVFDEEALVCSLNLLETVLTFSTYCEVQGWICNSSLSHDVKVGNELKESGENVFVGGKNRWKYSTFVNWELWWPNFPILVYFKERQTRPEGQVHFFPVIFNGKQLYDVMVERAGPSKTSGPN